jgi:UDP-N-acetyl-D-mannosaminuronic acid transferase (WecB/TagA/CpsF family)
MPRTLSDINAGQRASATDILTTDVLGVPVGHWTYSTAIARIIDLAQRRVGSAVAACNVHMVMTARR